ncbi:hypothetical protein J1N35_013641 [Gossypium stocksii]|uniref:RNase H type-1 domain-containing protein n=1 Tax=Gossypium stocksii TaxID=47602 RepID=A0A9D3VTB7_9ROSI|nr:hypothetical protein J1N35_013641 [Gossypium stocksii]
MLRFLVLKKRGGFGFRDIAKFNLALTGDSLTVVKKIGAKQGDKSNIRAIITDRKSRARCFLSYQFKLIPREANQAAHLMAKEAASYNIDRFWVEEVPASVRQQIIADRWWVDPPN